MGIRFFMMVVALLLSGCASVPSLSWSALSPFHWFASPLQLTDDGLGGITAQTPMQQAALSEGLNDAYPLRSGMGIAHGQVTRVYQAMEQDKVVLTITGEAQVQRITLDSAAIASAWGAKVGMPFADLYQRAFDGECRRIVAMEGTPVLCRAPQSQRVSYLFLGQWNGPAALMPPDDVLLTWPLSQIIWQADGQPLWE